MNKKTLALLLFILIVTHAFPQSKKKLAMKKKWPYFKDYTCQQKEIIIDNWTQYFQEDIHQKLDSNCFMFPIKYDSYGSLYPEENVFQNFEEKDFNPQNRNHISNYAFSMFDIFSDPKKSLISNLKLIKDDNTRNFYNSLKEDALELFYVRWDSFHVATKIRALRDVIKKGDYKKVLFFVHGYNVPYSLATIQAIELNKLLTQQGVQTDSILLVPLYWPSNNAKKHRIESEDAFTIKNRFTFSNATKNKYYANRAYFAAIGLRKLINGLGDIEGVKICLFSHSLGAVTVTSALINTYSRLQTSFGAQIVAAKDARDFLETNAENLRKKEPMNFQILKGLTSDSIPSVPVRVFMSAASTPGVSTFIDIDKNLIKNKTFYLPINHYDEMLNKQVVAFLHNRQIKFGSTSLGIDFRNEASITYALFENKENFKMRVVSNNEDHDILAYMLQPGYRKFVLEFITK